jgi:hypothetical protein
MATKGTQLETQLDKTYDLATRTHIKIWVDLMFSGKLRLSLLLVAPVMLFLNKKNNM